MALTFITTPQRFGFDVDARGNLIIGGVPAADLAARFGTPLHVVDEARMRANCRSYVAAMREHAPGPSRVVFASKALCIIATCQVAYEEGLGIDVANILNTTTILTAALALAMVRGQLFPVTFQ